jgi:carbonic anhydrase
MHKRATSDAFFKALDVFAENGYSRTLSFEEQVDNVPIQAFLDSLDGNEFYSYDGSLTTPPCTEGVRWTVLKNAAYISPDNLRSMNSRYVDNAAFAPGCENCSGGNNRETVAVNDRVIYYNVADDSWSSWI